MCPLKMYKKKTIATMKKQKYRFSMSTLFLRLYLFWLMPHLFDFFACEYTM